MFAVVNLGLKSIRLCLFDRHGRVLFKKSHPLHSVIFGEAVEQSSDEWWNLARQLFKEAAFAGHAVKAIEAITVSASSSCLVCLDAEGRVLRPIVMVSDRRHVKLGLPASMPVMQQRLAWLAAEEPEVHAASRHFLSPNDFLIERFTGEPVADSLNAEKFGYVPALGSYAGVDAATAARLPRVVEPGERAGVVRPEVARELGLGAATEVWVSSYDAIVSVAGSGALETGDLCDVSGTVTSVRLVSTARTAKPTGAVVTQSIVPLGQTYIGGSTNLGGGLIEWLKTTFYPGAASAYESLESDAESLSPGDCGLIFLPYLLGERAPIWNPDARGVFFGLERSHGRRHFARAVVESTAFIGLDLIREIEREHGAPARRIRLSGGLSRLGLVNRIKADVYGAPVEVMAEFESTALGAYLLAFHRLIGGVERPADWFRSCTRVRETIFPDPDTAAVYREKFAIFKETYHALNPVFGRLKQLSSGVHKSEDGLLENL